MYLKSLIISGAQGVIREINFHQGLNLIIDESENQITGNSVGKTTVLKLIDFCLGADSKDIYIDPETKRQEYKLVKDFLIENEVLITLILINSFQQNSDTVVIERNFLPKKNIIRKINGEQFTDKEFELKLSSLIFPEHHAEKPTFRQIISHNIRYKDSSINNTLKTLDTYTSDAEYETLYLYLFGCDFSKGHSKQEILAKIKQEETYKNRLEKEQTKTAYETTLALIENEIQALNKKKESFNLNENFEADLDNLNSIKFQINKLSSDIGKLNIRKNLIIETEEELSSSISNIDLKQLELIYSQATNNNIASLQKTFEDLVSFHNQMIAEKTKFITKELPSLEQSIIKQSTLLKGLLVEEKRLISILAKSDTFEDLEKVIVSLNTKHQQKGEYQSIIDQLNQVEININNYNDRLEEIDKNLFSESFEQVVKEQLNKFNVFFASISQTLYGEQYAIKHDIITNRKKQRLYKFSTFVPFGPNIASGKKQGEISCFDIAYTMFADDESIPCLHFLLNDKKELMHGNQLVKIAKFVNENEIQFVASILRDKLPPEINKDEYFTVKLSQSDKLFRIEENSKRLQP